MFSYAWKWAHCNRNAPVVPSLNKYCKATGFRQTTVKAAFNALMLYGYINAQHQPLITKVGDSTTLANGMPYLGFRKLRWMNAGNIKLSVFQCLWSRNKAYQNRPAWFVKTLGIGRATAHRFLKMVTTDETVVTTDETA